MQYVDRLGRFVSRDEATVGGVLRDGFSIRVPMMLTDNRNNLQLSDAELAFVDSAEGRAAIARAQMTHDLQYGHGQHARPFTAADEAQALKLAMAESASAATQGQQSAHDAERAEAAANMARDAYLDRLANPLR